MAVNWKILGILTLVIGMAVLLATILVYVLTGGEIPFDYGIVIDAGSSHSEAILYRWKGDKYKGTGEILQIANHNNHNGISTFKDPKEAGDSILPGLRNVSARVEEEKRSEIPVYLAATAGMRLVSQSNYFKSLAIFTALECAIPKSSMVAAGVGIISGQDEGLYAWITTNYILDTLKDKEAPTVGAADMGGASTQISFEVKDPQPNNTDVATLPLYGKKYQVYSVSYLCYGSMEIFRRYLASLIEDNFSVTEVPNPCGNPNQKLNFTVTELFVDQPCTKTRKVEEFVFLNPDKMDQIYTFSGTTNMAECRKHVDKLFDPAECRKKYKDCFSRIDPSIRPTGFMAFSSYYYTVDFMDAVNKSLNDYRAGVLRYCQRDWEEITNKTYIEAVKSVLPRYCFQGIVVEVILTQGYGFDESTWKHIQFANKVNGKSVGWALGYMTNATNAIPEEDLTDPAIGVETLIILVIVGTILLVFGGYMCFRKNNNRFVTSTLP